MQRRAGHQSTSNGHVPALDGVRGLAAAIVFFYHYGGGSRSAFLPLRILGNIVHFGWAGVSLFFVLSGFLISGILWRGFAEPDWWKRFYIRRSLRIFPLYYLAILLAFVAGVLLGYPPGRFKPLWIFILYLGDLPLLGGRIHTLPSRLPLTHFWSLAVEEQFYLIWPFLLRLFAFRRQSAMNMILVLWTMSLLFRAVVFHWQPPQEWDGMFLLSRAGELLAGAWLALAFREEKFKETVLHRAPASMLISGLCLVAMVITTGSSELNTMAMSTLGLSLCSIFFASTVASSLRPGWVQAFFVLPFLRWLGKISYGIYIYHLLLRGAYIWLAELIAPRASYNLHLVLVLAVAVVGTLAVASLSFYTYERWFLLLKDRLQ